MTREKREARRAARRQRSARAAVLPGEPLYRLSKLAQQAGVSLRTLERHIEKGLVVSVRIGPTQRRRVTETEFRKYLGIYGKDDPDDK